MICSEILKLVAPKSESAADCVSQNTVSFLMYGQKSPAREVFPNVRNAPTMESRVGLEKGLGGQTDPGFRSFETE